MKRIFVLRMLLRFVCVLILLGSLSTIQPYLAETITEMDTPLRLYAIVSDMGSSRETLLDSKRLFYQLALMDIAAEMNDSGRLLGVSLCTTQTQNQGFTVLSGDNAALAVGLYSFIENAQSAGDSISGNTWQAVERALDESLIEGVRPIIFLLYSDDMERIVAGSSLSDKLEDTDGIVFYLKGQKDLNTDGLSETLGAEAVILSSETNEESSLYIVPCEDTSKDVDDISLAISPVIQCILGDQREFSPFAPLSDWSKHIIVQPETRGGTTYSNFMLAEADEGIDTFFVKLSDMNGDTERVQLYWQDAVVNTEPNGVIVVAFGRDKAMADNECAITEGSMDDRTMLSVESEDSGDKRSDTTDNRIIGLSSDKVSIDSVFVRENLTTKKQQALSHIIQNLGAIKLLWPKKDDTQPVLSIDLCAVDSETFQQLQSEDCHAELHVLLEDEDLTDFLVIDSSLNDHKSQIVLPGKGSYQAVLQVEYKGLSAAQPLGSAYTVLNERPILTGKAVQDLGIFVRTEEDDTFTLLNLANCFSDKDAEDSLTYYVDGEPIKGNMLTIPVDTQSGTLRYSVTAYDGIEHSDALIVTATLKDLSDLFVGTELHLELSPEQLAKGDTGTLSVSLDQTALNDIFNESDVEQALSDAQLEVVFVPIDTNVPTIAPVKLTRNSEDDWCWVCTFTASQALSGQYQIFLRLNGIELNTSALLHVINKQPEAIIPTTEIHETLKGLRQSCDISLDLEDYIKTEPCDILTIHIDSSNISLRLDSENAILDQVNMENADTDQELTWNVQEQTGFPITLRITKLTSLGRTSGTLHLDVQDQEGEGCVVDIPFTVVNRTFTLMFIGIIAVAVLVFGMLITIVWRLCRVKNTQGLRFSVTLEDSLGRVTGIANASAWKGNRISLSNLLLLAKMPPQNVLGTSSLDEIQVYAKANSAQKGCFNAIWPRELNSRIEASGGKVLRNGCNGCVKLIIHGDKSGDVLQFSVDRQR